MTSGREPCRQGLGVCVGRLHSGKPTARLVSAQVWLQYQCLWDMQAENIYHRLGEDLGKWQALLVQIRKARGTFDNAETKREFGPVVIDYGKVGPAVVRGCRAGLRPPRGWEEVGVRAPAWKGSVLCSLSCRCSPR